MRSIVRAITATLATGLLLFLTAGCGGGDQQTDQQSDTYADTRTGEEAEAGFSVDDPVAHADQLWQRIRNYDQWEAPEGFTGWQPGNSPHGSVLRYYVDALAADDPTADGAIIVKENYSSEAEDALLSVTVMEKREGYDPETGDWFYVKYSPDGEVVRTPTGNALAGLVGKGQADGCIPCHANAGDDYLFMTD